MHFLTPEWKRKRKRSKAGWLAVVNAIVGGDIREV